MPVAIVNLALAANAGRYEPYGQNHAANVVALPQNSHSVLRLAPGILPIPT